MEINRCVKESFSVIGKEGSTMDGSGFIQRLWEDANSHFQEIEYLAKRDGNGAICGIWGAMSDLSHSFKPWEDNFTKGLYLAGVEAKDGEEAPEGWTVWRIPGYVCEMYGGRYIYQGNRLYAGKRAGTVWRGP